MRFVIRSYQPTNSHGLPLGRQYLVCDRAYGFKVITCCRKPRDAVRDAWRLERDHREHVRGQA